MSGGPGDVCGGMNMGPCGGYGYGGACTGPCATNASSTMFGRRGGTHDLMPTKHMIPKAMGSDTSKWREFRQDVEEWLNSFRPGMREVLKAIANAQEGTVVDYAYLAQFRSQIHASGGDLDELYAGRGLLYSAMRMITTE